MVRDGRLLKARAVVCKLDLLARYGRVYARERSIVHSAVGDSAVLFAPAYLCGCSRTALSLSLCTDGSSTILSFCWMGVRQAVGKPWHKCCTSAMAHKTPPPIFNGARKRFRVIASRHGPSCRKLGRTWWRCAQRGPAVVRSGGGAYSTEVAPGRLRGAKSLPPEKPCVVSFVD